MMTENEITKIIDSMTLQQKVGQLLMGGICGGESLELAKQRLNDHCLGGMQFSALFETFIRGGGYSQCGVCRNEPLAEVAKFLYDIKKAALDILPVPIIMASDQEGGISSSIIRRRNISLMPRPMGLGANGSPEDTYLSASVSAQEVKAIGLDMLYGPCLDVNTNPGNTEIGARSFGEDPEQVAIMAEQVVRAYAEQNVISNIKHFPGRGHGQTDAHWDMETLDLDRSRMDAVELLPFKRAIAAGADSIMLAHTHFPAFDPDQKIPASLSPNVIKGLIRKEMGFDGMILTDDMTMFSITKN